MNEIENSLYLKNRIKEILLNEWDPIGIQNIHGAQDEYDAYILPLYNLLMMRMSDKKILDYLWWIETEHMGLLGNRQHTKEVSKKLINIMQFYK